MHSTSEKGKIPPPARPPTVTQDVRAHALTHTLTLQGTERTWQHTHTHTPAHLHATDAAAAVIFERKKNKTMT